MKVNKFLLIDDFVDDISSHLESIFNGGFTDVTDGVNVFKNIQDRGLDIVSESVTEMLNEYDVAYNFVRRSPENQQDPNFIHSDEMMGDLTCLLYLNQDHPKDDGTTIYECEEDIPSVVFKSKLNRMVIFDSKLKHSRNIFDNFGQGDKARLVQVIFLKLK